LNKERIVFVTDDFKNEENFYGFYVDFYNYKNFGDRIDVFGRDARLDTPLMSHIHLAKNKELVDKWRDITNINERTTIKGKPKDDYWLIYAYDTSNEEYLILAIIGPNAHNRGEWTSYYNTLYHDIVLPWINGKITYTEPDESEDI